MSFAFLRRVSEEVSVLDSKSGDVSVNMHVTSSKDLAAAIERIKIELDSRREASPGVLADQLDHIEEEVAANGPVPLALEHLELYKAHSACLAK